MCLIRRCYPNPTRKCYGKSGICSELPFWSANAFWIRKHIWPQGFQIKGAWVVFSRPSPIRRQCLTHLYLGLTKIRKLNRWLDREPGDFLSGPAFSLLKMRKGWYLRPSDSKIVICTPSFSLKHGGWGITATEIRWRPCYFYWGNLKRQTPLSFGLEDGFVNSDLSLRGVKRHWSKFYRYFDRLLHSAKPLGNYRKADTVMNSREYYGT